MREAATRLANRNRVGRDVFSRGAPEPIEVVRQSEFSATLYDLLSAYAARRQERAISVVYVKARQVWSLQDARDVLGRIIGRIADWTPLEAFLSPYLATDEHRATVKASTFGASLELVREGKIDLRQTQPFAPLYIRDRVAVAAVTPEAGHG
jgi:segregation and condensation protein A